MAARTDRESERLGIDVFVAAGVTAPVRLERVGHGTQVVTVVFGEFVRICIFPSVAGVARGYPPALVDLASNTDSGWAPAREFGADVRAAHHAEPELAPYTEAELSAALAEAIAFVRAGLQGCIADLPAVP